MKKLILTLIVLTITISCSTKTVDVRSPCVSNDGGPCGPKKPINDWWLNKKHV